MSNNKSEFTEEQLAMLPNGKWEGINPIKRLTLKEIRNLEDGVFKSALRDNLGVFKTPQMAISSEGISDADSPLCLMDKYDQPMFGALEKAAFKSGIPTPPKYRYIDKGEESAFLLEDSAAIVVSLSMIRNDSQLLDNIALHEMKHGFQGKLDESKDFNRALYSASTAVTIATIGIIPLNIDEIITLATAALSSTALASHFNIKAKNIQHEKEFDADEYAVRNSTHPERLISFFEQEPSPKKPEITNLKEAVAYFWKKSPINVKYIRNNTHPPIKNRISHMEKAIEGRNKAEREL